MMIILRWRLVGVLWLMLLITITVHSTFAQSSFPPHQVITATPLLLQQPVRTPTPFRAIPFQDRLSTLGLEIATEPPEGGILALHLPNVYILPNSPFYFFKKIWEGTQIFLASEDEQRGEVLLSLAEKRLSETFQLLKQGDLEGVVATLRLYEGQFSQARGILSVIADEQMQSKLRQLLTEHSQIQALFYSFVKKLGLPEILSQMEFMKPRGLGGLELRPL